MPEFLDIRMPADTQEGTQSFVGRWLKQCGDSVRIHEPIIEITTDKVSLEVAAPQDGVLREIIKLEGSSIEPGEVLGRMETGKLTGTATGPSGSIPGACQDEAQSAARSTSTADVRSLELSPAVRKLLAQNSLDPSLIAGTGRDGRITHQDVISYLENRGTEKGQPSSGAIPSRRIRHTPMRLSIAGHMTQSLLHTAPHVTSIFEADMSAVIRHREANRREFEQKGVKLTFTSYFVRAAVEALKVVPEANGRWHAEDLEIYDDINIGIATALDDGGLIVPVIHRAQELSLKDTATRLEDLTSRARSGKLGQADVQGGTFTISNHGVSGSLIATPIIINQPQSAILGTGKLEKRVVVVEENGKEVFKAVPRLYVTLTIDHRVLDGYRANTFLQAFVGALQTWSTDK